MFHGADTAGSRTKSNCRVVNAPLSTGVPYKDERRQERSNSANVNFKTASPLGYTLIRGCWGRAPLQTPPPGPFIIGSGPLLFQYRTKIVQSFVFFQCGGSQDYEFKNRGRGGRTGNYLAIHDRCGSRAARMRWSFSRRRVTDIRLVGRGR
jgi:hypothetical protein